MGDFITLLSVFLNTENSNTNKIQLLFSLLLYVSSPGDIFLIENDEQFLLGFLAENLVLVLIFEFCQLLLLLHLFMANDSYHTDFHFYFVTMLTHSDGLASVTPTWYSCGSTQHGQDIGPFFIQCWILPTSILWKILYLDPLGIFICSFFLLYYFFFLGCDNTSFIKWVVKYFLLCFLDDFTCIWYSLFHIYFFQVPRDKPPLPQVFFGEICFIAKLLNIHRAT